jgi:hypothetical protein
MIGNLFCGLRKKRFGNNNYVDGREVKINALRRPGFAGNVLWMHLGIVKCVYLPKFEL